MPAGPCHVLIANLGTASPVYVGAGATVSTLTGFPVPSGAVSPVVIQGYPASAGAALRVVTASGSASVAFLISTATGQTGP
jgi:hypothetical protein